ncbi:CheY chemotaxis protein or a CheY-like REC (receiver) domain [Maridesulfovibrio ferrireducens]|uniref:CheY chemotaxis protein or a CheY-like REC (Receiver) domain n=1 Tax=Maridesulfovibrio ferrireducens TaxID=246191 RepID=A0A1G9EL19_9BACT|nr:response regulator [Maridesulfovibrio ferrireducens]SDK76887.1 CheY chemotaxis protein or a CheY-like REC (receiver) domain [Maridesulfovibrio ferrireducens]
MLSADQNNITAYDSKSVSGKVLKILLAEDCENNVLLVQLYLKKFPYSIDVAENGEMAFEMYKKNRYDLVLMDIEMPFTDGYQATTSIRHYENDNGLASTPIIAVTAHALCENRDKAYDVGCDYFMTKPVRKADLISAIQKFTEDQ